MFLVSFRYNYLFSLSYIIHDHISYAVKLSCLNKRWCCCCCALKWLWLKRKIRDCWQSIGRGSFMCKINCFFLSLFSLSFFTVGIQHSGKESWGRTCCVWGPRSCYWICFVARFEMGSKAVGKPVSSGYLPCTWDQIT